jgi:transposase
MAKYKPYDFDQLVMIPISLEDQLEPGTLEYTINELVEKNIDLSVFEGWYQNDDTGATAINPKVLLKVILFAYSRGMISSRQIERACGENILFYGAQLRLSSGSQYHCPFCVLDAEGDREYLQQHSAGMRRA